MKGNSFLKIYNSLNINIKIFLMIAFAFMFSFACRIYWIEWASNFSAFFYDGTLMISTNDGYAFGEGARDMLNGFHQENDLSYFGSSLSTLTYWVVKIFNIKLEIAMLYMSVFFSSLIVIPIFLIAAEYKNLQAGFSAALLASIADSYYNRTMAGYYDTDMLTVVFPTFLVWSLIRVLQKNNIKDIIIAPCIIIAYSWWYQSGLSLILATLALFVFYIFVFDRKNTIFYSALVLLVISICSINLYLKLFLIFAFYICFLCYPALSQKRFLIASLSICFCLFAFSGGLKPMFFLLKFYLFRQTSEVADISFKFFNVNQTIQESGIIDLTLFCQRISGSVAVFLFSFVGLLMLCFRQKTFMVGLGMLFLGFLSLKGGLRFTIYSVPMMALGFGFLLYNLLDLIKNNFNFYSKFLYPFILFFALLPCINHIYNYKISPVFLDSEVDVLSKLKKIANRQDYVLAWWDYGYPIRYYSDVKTLVDGGKHLGKDNFAVSYSLANSQSSSANMARLEVEYTEKKYKENFTLTLSKMMKDKNQTDINEFLISLSDVDFALPKSTRDIYYYLPDRMMYIFPTILQFSRLDLKTGSSWGDAMFYLCDNFSQNKNGVDLGNSIFLSNDLSYLQIGDSKLRINSFHETKYDENSKLNISSHDVDLSSNIYVIYMKDYSRFLILDEAMFYSAYIQLFVLENYDKELFEPIILEPQAKVYKLKK